MLYHVIIRSVKQSFFFSFLLMTLIRKYQLVAESVVSCNYQISEAKLIL